MTHPRLGLALGLALAATGAHAAEVAPEARRLLDDVARAYKALPSYADQGVVTLAYETKPGMPPTVQATPARAAIARPNRLAIDAGVVRVVSDGKTVRTIVPPFRTYRDVPATARLGLNDVSDGPLGAVQFSGPQGRAFHVVLALLLAEDPTRSMVEDARSIRVTRDDKRDGLARHRLDYEPQVGPTLTLWVDPATSLLDRIDVDLATKDPAVPAVPNSPLTIRSLAWTSGPVETKSVPDSAFALVKPEGFSEIAGLAKDVSRAKAENDLVGKAAPDFTIEVLDGPGKTRRVKGADLKGKVVLLDFWATWCGPCMKELPDIGAMVADYANAKKPVVVVALSIDEADDGDPEAVRALVEKTLKEKELNLQVPPVGRVALDPSSSTARAFKVSAIPQLVVIDAKGVVRHVHIGVTGRDALAGEVDALVAEAAKP